MVSLRKSAADKQARSPEGVAHPLMLIDVAGPRLVRRTHLSTLKQSTRAFSPKGQNARFFFGLFSSRLRAFVFFLKLFSARAQKYAGLAPAIPHIPRAGWFPPPCPPRKNRTTGRKPAFTSFHQAARVQPCVWCGRGPSCLSKQHPRFAPQQPTIERQHATSPTSAR
jgi:hypothetical protein